MDLLKLKYFYVVAQLEHVTKASEELHVAQPAITKTIKLLEEQLNAQLFKRVGRNIKLTEYGQLLKSRLDEVFPIIDSVADEIEQLKNQNKLSVKINVLAASDAVLQAVVRYKDMYPEVIFNLIQNKENKDCDITITTDNNIAIKNSKNREIIEEQIFLAVPKGSIYANREEIKLEELKEENFVYIAGSRPFRSVCDNLCKKAGFKAKIGFESDSPLAVKNIISAEIGVGFWPEYSWGKVKGRDVKLIKIAEKDFKRQIIVELSSDRQINEHGKRFYEYLLSRLKKMQKAD